MTLLHNDAAPRFAFQVALEDVAREHDIATATFAAKRLEVRTPLNLTGRRWPLRPLLMLLVAGSTGVITFLGFVWLVKAVLRTRLYGASRSEKA